jgi:PHP family Zn ribbon phosphoesterase
LEKLAYKEVTSAIIANDSSRFKFTIETDPAYGKYHWTGHRNCKVSLSSSEAIKLGNICPVCRKNLTKGVEQRVEELADRPADSNRPDEPGFLRLLPLSEIIATVLGADSPSTQAVWKNYNLLIEKFGDEYAVLIEAPLDALAQVVESPLAQAIVRVREGSAKVTPGYDGVYGQLVLGVDTPPPLKAKPNLVQTIVKQRSMNDFW